MTDDDHDTWLREARALLDAVQEDRQKLEPALRHLCRRAFRDFQFPPFLIVDYPAVSTPSLLDEAEFSDQEIEHLMPTVDRVVGDEWTARGMPDYPSDKRMWSKVKALLRKARARTLEALTDAIGRALAAVTRADAAGWFKCCGYRYD